ncbi:preprotein translocase subunit SecG [bacterium]|nr:preprotein translocase subunit SecG [bacterium]
MTKMLNLIEIVVSLLLITAILLQARGGGLGSLFGGGGEFYQTKRGAEKGIFVATIILAVLFVVTGIIRLIIAK